MSLSSIYKRIALTSPYMEILLRRIYWSNVGILKKYNPNKAKSQSQTEPYVDFEKVIDWLRKQGVGEGSLLVVHSSYGELECTGLSPKQIIDRLLELVGPSGTLAMPAIRKYKEEPKYENILATNMDNVVCRYNVRKTPIISGILPYTMLKYPGSKVSNHPLNPLVAIGALAEQMMEHNIEGEKPSPHGPNSCWKFCYDNDAIIIGLGVDLNHYNTISHINEEAFGNWKWSNDKWFRLRQFDVIDDMGECRRIVVRERKPEWGMLRFAELHANKDRNDAKLITREKVGSIIICSENSKIYIDHLQNNNKNNKYFYI